MTNARLCTAAAIGFFTLLVSPRSAQARQHQFEIATGVAATSNALPKANALAAVIRLGVAQAHAGRPYRVRLDAEASFASVRASAERAGVLRSIALSYGVTAGPSRHSVNPFGSASAGVAWVSGYGGEGWPGLALTSRTGVGIRFPLARRELIAELGVVASWSNVSALRPRALYWPLTIGLAF